MKLFLVQHGEAVSESVDGGRPLSAEGVRDVHRLGRLCRSHGGVSASEILHSGKLRAEQTAAILSEYVPSAVRAIAGLDPLDPVKPYAEELADRRADLVVVGHNPFLERLATALLAGREEPPAVVFQRGGMACLERRGPGEWRLLWTVFPDQPGNKEV